MDILRPSPPGYMPPRPGASYEPQIAYIPCKTVLPGSGAAVPMQVHGDYLGLIAATPFIQGADIAASDRIWVCVNSKSFDPGSAIPLLPGHSIRVRFNDICFALRSFPDPSQPPVQNTVAGTTIMFEVSQGITITRQDALGAVVSQSSGVQTGIYGDNVNGIWVNVRAFAAGIAVGATPTPATVATGQMSAFRNGLAGTILNTGHDIKATPGNVYGWQIRNSGTIEAFVQFYNASAAATIATGLGTAVPLFTVPILGSGRIIDFSQYGIAFSARISVFATLNFDGSGGAPATALTGEVLFA